MGEHENNLIIKLQFAESVIRDQDKMLEISSARIAELGEALEEIGFRTDHGNPNQIDCPICKIVDRVIR